MNSKLNVASMFNEIRNDVARARERAVIARAARGRITQDAMVARKIAGQCNVTGYVTVSNWEHTAKLNASITLTVDSLKDDPTLTAILERALEHAEPVRTSDYVQDWVAERSFIFHLPNGGGLTVEATLRDSETNETCRKVKIGVKLVEQAEYKIVCK